MSRDEAADPGSTARRRKTREEPAAAGRLARVEQAIKVLGEAEARRAEREKTNKAQTAKQTKPRASTSDPQARVMKMPDGGVRPACNVQFASLPGSGIVIGVSVTTAGTDKGLAEPMAQAIATAYGRRPVRHLVDGGYQQAGDIEAAHRAGTTLYAPPQKAKSGADPHAPKPGDGGVAAWRRRMATDEAKTIYGRRSRCELVHAKLRNLHSTGCSCAAATRSRPGWPASPSARTSSRKPACVPRWPDTRPAEPTEVQGDAQPPPPVAVRPGLRHRPVFHAIRLQERQTTNSHALSGAGLGLRRAQPAGEAGGERLRSDRVEA